MLISCHFCNYRTIFFRNVCGGERFVTGVAELDRVIREALPCIMLTPLDCYWEGSLLQAPDEPVDPIDEEGCLPPNSPTFNESVTWGNLDFEKLSECLLNSPDSNYTFFVDQVCIEYIDIAIYFTIYQCSFFDLLRLLDTIPKSVFHLLSVHYT